MSRYIRKEITSGITWTAPAGVTQITISLVDKFDQLINTSVSSQRFGLKRNGALFTTGLNDFGQLGDGTIVNKSNLTATLGGHSFIRVAGIDNTAFGLKSDGSVFAWGENFYGTIGDSTSGSLTSKSVPIAVVGGHKFVNISGYGDTILAQKADGSLWGWGYNLNGVIGDGTLVNKSSPVPVVGGHSFISISIPGFALKADGSIWGWGDNTYGQLGDGTVITRSSPVAAIGGHSFVSFVGIGTGQQVLALKNDGSVWMWGRNDSGVLGDGTILNRSSPVQVIGGHSFAKITYGYFPLALKADGSAWSWGFNNQGGLGDGTPSTHKSSPVQVIGGHSFIFASRYQLSNSYGLKADGSIWTWGQNDVDGQLGDGTAVSKSSPVQVIGGHSFVQTSISGVNALKTDGTIWGWSVNFWGQLGDNTVVTRSSPVTAVGGNFFQIGTQVIAEKTAYVTPGTSYSIDMLSSLLFGIVPTQTLGNNVYIVLEYTV